MATVLPVQGEVGVDDLATLRAVWDAVADGLALSDAEGKVLAVNHAYCRLYGFAPDELVGRSFSVIFPEEAREQAERDYRAIFKRGEPVVVESTVRNSTQSELLVEARTSFIERDGRPVAMLSTIHDVTAHRRGEAERELFIASASHDLRQPLALIRARAQLLLRRARKDSVSPEALQAGAQAIVTAVDDVTAQLALLVDGARRRAGQPLLLQLEPVELSALVGELVSQHQASSEGYDFVFDAPPTPVAGRFDATRLRRVIGNLLSNAVKYSPSGGEILVRLTMESRTQGPEAVLEVQDHGLGIPSEDLPHVFEHYHRGTNVADQVPGSGLGLAGALEIVERHGGSLEVESEEGHGSLFRLRLPISSVAHAERGLDVPVVDNSASRGFGSS